MGKEPRRELSGDSFKAAKVLLESCPWNFESKRFENVAKLLHSFGSMLTWSSDGARKVLFFCKKGERRSAAVLMVILCEIFGFTRNAAKSQIEDRRSVAQITMVSEGTFPPSWPEVNQILDWLEEL
jgi:protein-tyrosine phosphatase